MKPRLKHLFSHLLFNFLFFKQSSIYYFFIKASISYKELYFSNELFYFLFSQSTIFILNELHSTEQFVTFVFDGVRGVYFSAPGSIQDGKGVTFACLIYYLFSINNLICLQIYTAQQPDIVKLFCSFKMKNTLINIPNNTRS